LRRPCRLRAEQADGTLRWQLDASPGLGSDAMDPGDAGAVQQIALSRLGRHVGTLQLLGAAAPGHDAAHQAAQLEPVRASALLLSREAHAGGGSFLMASSVGLGSPVVDGVSPVDYVRVAADGSATAEAAAAAMEM
jgi:hypothetical protein